jgi:ATP-dependent exoDNAse (exonuclease V) beta subunit
MADKSGYSRLADMTGSQSCADILALPHKEIEYMQSVKSEARTVDIRTIHSSKGMEADSVVVVSSMTRSSIESLYKNPDAEHRVSYVAATRAKSNLLVISDEHAYPFPVRPT